MMLWDPIRYAETCPSSDGACALVLAAEDSMDPGSVGVVVATVPSLSGLTVEDYANRLYRHWALGQKDKNNGALLLVAPSERKVRIEVGYGLEGALTDALTDESTDVREWRIALQPRRRRGESCVLAKDRCYSARAWRTRRARPDDGRRAQGRASEAEGDRGRADGLGGDGAESLRRRPSWMTGCERLSRRRD